MAKYFNWWPAKPLIVEVMALRLSFQIDLAYNFLEAHHESSIKVRGVGFCLPPVFFFFFKICVWDKVLYSVDVL